MRARKVGPEALKILTMRDRRFAGAREERFHGDTGASLFLACYVCSNMIAGFFCAAESIHL